MLHIPEKLLVVYKFFQMLELKTEKIDIVIS